MHFQINRVKLRDLTAKLRRVALILGLVSLQFGCASYSKQQVNQTIAQYKGLSLQQLIAVWGVPSKQFELNGQYFVEWITKEQSGSSSISIGTGSGGRHSFFGLGITLPIERQDDVCVRRATTDDKQQTVLQIDWQGDPDFCGELLYSLKNKS